MLPLLLLIALLLLLIVMPPPPLPLHSCRGGRGCRGSDDPRLRGTREHGRTQPRGAADTDRRVGGGAG